MKLENMFFEFKYVNAEGSCFHVSSRSRVYSETEKYPKAYVENVIAGCPEEGRSMDIRLYLSVPESIREKLGTHFCENKECYAVEILDDTINLYALTDNGLTYGVSTLLQLIESRNVRQMLLFDYPDRPIRGYRAYTPGRENIPAFKQVVDKLIYLKYNTMMIEVGGAMEYKRHPEINKKWVELGIEIRRGPDEAERIVRRTHPQWRKNCIQFDNGDGSFITQEEMREIVEYCRERGLEVIPEVPTLSHSDYLVMAHPEIREREADTYPDTYCPSNPRSYELVFDLLDEIIGVFQPNFVNIGHDECYSLAKCPRCAGKNPTELYVGDIIKLNDYLKSRNIKSIMWADKFFGNVYLMDKDGTVHGFGGTADERWDIPYLADCVGKVPKDVMLFHWYWPYCTREEEQNLRDLGYEIIYGNFQALSLKDYRNRITGTGGAMVSNWGSYAPEYMQRNGQNFNLAAAAWTLWSDRYDSDMSTEITEEIMHILYSNYKSSLGSHIIELAHTTTHDCPYRAFYDGVYIIPEDWAIGEYTVTYTDGTKASLPITFGYNIRCCTESFTPDGDYEDAEATTTGIVEVAGASLPIQRGDKMFYKTAYKNPHPEKEIQKIECVPMDGIEIETVYDI